jgi:hypothetical protein
MILNRLNRQIKSYSDFLNEDFLSNIFKGAHAATKKEDLTPLKTLLGKGKFPSKEEFDAAVNYLGIDGNYLFYDKGNMLNPIIYWNGPIYYGFPGLDMELLRMMRVKEYLEQKTKFVKDKLAKKDFSGLFMRVDKKILIPTFIDMYKEIPNDQKYDIFITLYERSEYGFNMFPKELIREVFSLRNNSSDRKERMAELNKVMRVNKDGTVTVYRGENTESTKEQDAYSWTLDKKIADFFANRFSRGTGKILTKKIKPEEILDYLPDRSESEVLIMPNSGKNVKEGRIKMFEDFDEVSEPIGLAILGAPAGGKSYAKKLITHISKLVKLARATDPEIGTDLTVDILRGKILQLPPEDQLDLFYMAFYTMKELAAENTEYEGWFQDIKKTWLNKIAPKAKSDIKIENGELIINGKIGEEALDQLKTLDAKEIIGSLDNYSDYKRIVRAYQQIKQKEATGSKKDVVYDESGDEPEKIIGNMKNLKKDDYVTDVIMIHHDEVTNNLLQNASRMINGGDGGRDSSASIIDAYNKIDQNLPKYSKNAEVAITTNKDELQKGEGPAPDALSSATRKDDSERGNKPIDVFVRVKGDKPNVVYDRTIKDMDEEKKNVLKALLKYQIQTPKINVPEVAKKTILGLIGEISNSEALNILTNANAGKLKNKYVFEFGGINDNLIEDAKKILINEAR